MPVGPTAAALALTAGSISLAIRLTTAEPLSTTAAITLALLMVVLALATATGLLLTRSRWARWSAIATAISWFVVAAAAALGTGWLVALAAGALVVVIGAGPGAVGWLRTRAAADGPPPSAVVLLLGLLGYAGVVALADFGAMSAVAALGATGAAVGAIAYSRGGVWGVVAMRGLIVIAVALGVAGTPWPAALAPALIGLALVGLAWVPEIKNAAAPVIPQRGTGYRLPPELAPKEILDAAGFDEHGRPK